MLEARSLSIGFSKFVGCKINVEKILNEIKNQVHKDSKNNEKLFFEFFLLKFQSKETKNLKFFKKFPMINNNKIKLLKNNLEKNKFYEIAKKISNLLQQEEMKEENQNNISKNTTQKSKSLTKEKKKVPLNKEKKKN